MAELLESSFGELASRLVRAGPQIRDRMFDFSRYIENKSRGFVGRKFVFERFRRFSDKQDSGYFIVRGDPGIGKSAIAAELVKRYGLIHHFNIRSQGVNSVDQFLTNVCAQLIGAYALDFDTLPDTVGRDSRFMLSLLDKVSDGLHAGEKLVLVIDALDEVDNRSMPSGANILCLPESLPSGVFVVCTSRHSAIPLRVDCAREVLGIEHDSVDNERDVLEFVEGAMDRPLIRARIEGGELSREDLISTLTKRSQGNFIYLHYVIPEIERGKYRKGSLDALPAGLESYYEDHWRRMKGEDESTWYEYKLPIVMALTVAREAVSIDLLSAFSGVVERARIRGVLEEWSQFLYVENREVSGSVQPLYRIYHETFHEFIEAKEQVADERIDRRGTHQRIATELAAIYSNARSTDKT